MNIADVTDNPVDNTADFSVLPEEVVRLIMSYWRPYTELQYLDQLKAYGVLVSVGYSFAEFMSSHDVIFYRSLYCDNIAFKEYILDYIRDSPDYTDIVEKIKCLNPQIKTRIQHATLIWNRMKVYPRFTKHIKLLRETAYSIHKRIRLRISMRRSWSINNP